MRLGLTGVQSALWSVIASGEAGSAQEWVVETPGFSAEDRVRVYANMTRARQVEALAVDFPTAQAALGPQRFAQLADRYCQACPSTHPSLGRRGEKLEAFLREEGEPALADLVAFEWARAEVFLEREAEPLRLEALQATPAEQFPALRLRAVPAFRFLSLQHDPTGAWRQREAGEAVQLTQAPAPVALAVWRQGEGVFHARLAESEATALRRLVDGAALAEVLEAFGAEPEAVQAAFAALATWINEGWMRL